MKDTASCRVDDIFTSAVRSKTSHAFVSTLPLWLIVSPAVGCHYREKRWQRGEQMLGLPRASMRLQNSR